MITFTKDVDGVEVFLRTDVIKIDLVFALVFFVNIINNQNIIIVWQKKLLNYADKLCKNTSLSSLPKNLMYKKLFYTQTLNQRINDNIDSKNRF